MSIRFATLLPLFFLLFSCAYQFGTGTRGIPGGYKSISVPIFKNKSYETGIEVNFTNALLQELQRGGVTKVVPDSLSEARVEGEITEVRYFSDAKIEQDDNSYLPQKTVLTTDYTVSVSTSVRVIRRSDGIEIWAGTFSRERQYTAPQVTIAGLNSVNPLYNQSARRQQINSLASDLMAEAYNRMTESF